LKRTLRVAFLLTFACAALVAFSTVAQAQKVDLAFGVSTLLGPGASSANCPTITSCSHTPVSLSGGAYPGFSVAVEAFHHIGLGGEIYWRGSQAQNYDNAGFNYRPIFWNINATYSPKIASHTYLDLVGGIGALSTHYYTGTYCGPFTCSNYQSINHFDGDFGAGIKFYPHGNWFVRPEARFYLIHNNYDFSSWYTTRVGASIGYTFGRH
jgi:Outer membrane protein beta-barrel domain